MLIYLNKGEINMQKKAIRILDVLPMDRARGITREELDSFKMYKVIEPGVLRENCGIKRRRSDIIVCDVTSASSEFKEKYSDRIVEMDVSEIQPAFYQEEEKCYLNARKILDLLPVDGIYSSLSRDEMNRLGHNYVSIQSTQFGTRVTPVIISKTLPDNLYLIVNTATIGEELFEKISSELVELSKKENRLYDNKGLAMKPIKPKD